MSRPAAALLPALRIFHESLNGHLLAASGTAAGELLLLEVIRIEPGCEGPVPTEAEVLRELHAADRAEMEEALALAACRDSACE